MKKIPFKYNFLKLHDQKTAELIRIKIVSRTELDMEMVDMDTQYYTNKEIPGTDESLRGIEHYHLPNGSLLLLCFLGDRNIPFTTLRQFKDATWKKYKALLNYVFEIVVEVPDAKKEV